MPYPSGWVKSSHDLPQAGPFRSVQQERRNGDAGGGTVASASTVSPTSSLTSRGHIPLISCCFIIPIFWRYTDPRRERKAARSLVSHNKFVIIVFDFPFSLGTVSLIYLTFRLPIFVMSSSPSLKAQSLTKLFLQRPPAADGSIARNIAWQMDHRLDLVSFWGITPGSRVLEIGCGQGDCTIVLADAVGESGHVDAVDPGAPDYGMLFS